MRNKPSGRELYVSEISFDATEEDLRKLFALCGTVSSLHLVTDPKSGLFKGSAFIRMGSAAEAKDAVATLDGARLIDRCLAVSPARPKAPPAAPAAAPAAKPPRAPRPKRQRR